MKVLIVGAGIGGLTAALACRAAGHDVHVIEQAEAFGEVGAGIQIGPNSARLLHRLGLEAGLEAMATKPEYGIIRDGTTGHRVSLFPLSRSAQIHYGVPYYHIHRADLIQLLGDAFTEGNPDSVTFNAQVNAVDEVSGRVRIRTGGGGLFSADLVVGADGIHSRVRDFVLGEEEPTFSGLVAWRGLVPFDSIANAHRYDRPQIWIGRGRHVVVYPLRQERVYNFVGVVNSTETEIESWAHRADNTRLTELFADWHVHVRDMIAGLERPFAWGLYDRPPASGWSRNNALLIGDAVHPMLPAMAQGASMAIEDGYTLGRLLANRAPEELPGVMQQFERQRSPRTRQVYHQASMNLDFFHCRNPLLKLFGNAALRTVGNYSEELLSRKFDWLFGYDPEPVRAPEPGHAH